MSKTWVYSKTEKAKIVDQEEAEELYKKSWADTPAKFKDDDSKLKAGDKITLEDNPEIFRIMQFDLEPAILDAVLSGLTKEEFVGHASLGIIAEKNGRIETEEKTERTLINIDMLTKEELIEYACKNLTEEQIKSINKRDKKEVILEAVKKFEDGK